MRTLEQSKACSAEHDPAKPRGREGTYQPARCGGNGRQ
eukprot:COSAG04_NODE_30257_length_264_cov_0.612121_1_plen_37_part_01